MAAVVKKPNYSNAKEYLNFISTFPRISRPRPGRFVVFSYLFHLNPLYKKRPDLKKYLDFQPCDIVLSVRPKKGYFQCINLHALPVRTRQIFIARLKKNYEQQFEQDRVFISGINYKKLFRYLRKIGVAVRNYVFERVLLLREIPSEKIDEMMKRFPNFFYQSNQMGVDSRYRKYVPQEPE